MQVLVLRSSTRFVGHVGCHMSASACDDLSPPRLDLEAAQALLGLLNLAIGSPALATNSAVSAVSASWPLSAMDCTSTVGQPSTRERNLLAHPTLDMYIPLSKFESIHWVSIDATV